MNLNHTIFLSFKIRSEYQEAYDFEIYDVPKSLVYFSKYRSVLYGAIGVYLAFILLGQRWMRNRSPYGLNTALVFWNAGLAIFSIVSTIRGLPETIYLLSKPNGIYSIICEHDAHNYATAFWGLMFALSKFVELGDTVFIVLRKQRLIFLHWYHHITVLLLSWFGYEFADTFAHLYVVNTFVHSFMYTYYALRALKIKIPRRVAMLMTILQISQMVLYCFVNLYSLFEIGQGRPCNREASFLYGILLIIASYFVLFVNFFVRAYLRPSKTKTQ
ncbi:unnamed protein product [Allacma fusca]|uniref:Elongation of very long chain fatty acids protein n=1 Tax=Allacma fusca TaxID=39272 RepID=A0A8J2PVZ5_9HEXA|nr:unnamed protein product [Allacma fusca]